MRVILFALTVLFTPLSCSADDLYICPPASVVGRPVIDHPDQRMRDLFVDVVDVIHFRRAHFALCQTEGHRPEVVPIPLGTTELYAVVLPTYVSNLSKTALLGVVAHELGHIPILVSGLPYQGLLREVAVDRLAAMWVGKDTIVQALREMQQMIHYYPQEQQLGTLQEIAYRIERLQNDL